MPTFSNLGKNWYSDTVPENIELHSPLSVQIQATSPMSRKLIYSIVKGNELEEFAVDFNTGKQSFLHISFYSLFFLSRLHLKHSLSVYFTPATFPNHRRQSITKIFARSFHHALIVTLIFCSFPSSIAFFALHSSLFIANLQLFDCNMTNLIDFTNQS